MSGSLTPTVVAAPTAIDVAANLLATQAAISGVLTDYNPGSQFRTQSEAIGSVVEVQGVTSQALVLQAMAFAAMAALGITQSPAAPAGGTVTFATALPASGAPLATQGVPIPIGTLVQTVGGVVFQTMTGSVLASGTTSVNVPVQALVGGSAGNVPALAVSGAPMTAIGYPLFVQNAAPMTGGADAESPSSAQARFTAAAAALGLASPVAIANACIGVAVSGEVVRYASCFEAWLAAGSGAGSGTAGFTVYIDNGTGAASTGLLAAVSGYLTGSVSQNKSGFRPAGVPWSIAAVTPVYANVTVSGTLVPGLISPNVVANAVTSGVSSYFAGLGFFTPAQQPQIAADVANAGLGFFQSLTVSLFYSGSGTAVTQVTGATGTRIVLALLTVNIGVGT